MFNIPPYQAEKTDWAWRKEIFSEQELDMLEAEAALADEEARTGSGGGQINKMRRSKLRWISPHSNEHFWLFQKLSHVVGEINARYFRLELAGFGEHAQLTRYEADVKGEYDWHQDYGTQVSRKLSLAVQLTDPNKYKGGDFEFMCGGNDIQCAKRERGMIVAFPSFQLHRVTPVTKGVRHSLVVWVSGPPFR